MIGLLLMKKLYALMAKVAKADVTVLMQGESGTGKEIMAQYIHQNSLYHAGQFIAVRNILNGYGLTS